MTAAIARLARVPFVHHFLRAISLPRLEFGWRIKAVVTVMVAVFGFAYVMQTNTLATSGYVIHELQNDIDSKQSDIQKLETKVASFQSITSIQERLKNSQLVPVDKISYLKAKSAKVAER